MMKTGLFALFLLIFITGPAQVQSGIYNPQDFGIIADGLKLDTRAIQLRLDGRMRPYNIPSELQPNQ